MHLKDLCILSLLILFFSCGKDDEMIDKDVACFFTQEEREIIEDINMNYAHVFQSSDPDSLETEALTSLITYLGDAEIVGLGEATHGSAEFFEMKDKIFRNLVLNEGFDAIIFEIPWGNALVVEDFVINGNGTADDALDETWYWVFDTKETIALADWMYSYNQTVTPENKIHFVGCDPQGPDFEVEKQMIYDYLREISPEFNDSVYLRYVNLPVGSLMEYDEISGVQTEENRVNVAWVYEQMLEKRESFVSQTGLFEYEKALMASHVIQHREMMYRKQSFGQTRDSLMAIYSSWWQRIINEDAQVAVWAHNAHVMDNQNPGGMWMGSFLRNERGAAYKNVGFTFGTGRLNAFLADSGGGFLNGVQEQILPSLKCNTLNALLSELDPAQYYLIFDEFSPGNTRGYFSQLQSFYQMGAGFNNAYLNNYTRNVQFSEYWDILIHFDEVRATELD